MWLRCRSFVWLDRFAWLDWFVGAWWLGQVVEEGLDGLAAAGVEGDFFADVAAGFGVAHFVHEVDDAVELRGFEGEDPFVVAECKGRYGVGAHVGVFAGGFAVGCEDLAAFVGWE